jgi:hypothetical protein
MTTIDDGEKGKAGGMNRAERGANPKWKLAAAIAVADAAKQLPKLTTDDVLTFIDPNVCTHEMRALGPVMRNAAKDGWIVQAYELPKKCATRPSNHRRPLTVWKSLVFKGRSDE